MSGLQNIHREERSRGAHQSLEKASYPVRNADPGSTLGGRNRIGLRAVLLDDFNHILLVLLALLNLTGRTQVTELT